MKKLLLSITFIAVQISFASEIFKVNLAKNEKLEGSFSINNTTKETTHFLFIKDSESKKYIIKPYFLSENKTIKEIESITTNEKPNFISNYTYNNHLIVSSYDEKSKLLSVLNFDLVSGKSSSSVKSKFEKPDLVFSQSDKTILVTFVEKGKKVSIDFISNSGSFVNKMYTPSEAQYKELKSIATKAPDAINQNEFVENGSIKDERAYVDLDNFYLTKNNSDKTTSVFTFDLQNSNAISHANFNLDLDKNTKDHNTFVFGGNLISISSSLDDLSLKSFDLKTQKIAKSFTLKKDLHNVLDSEAATKFLAEEKKIALKITVTGNKTKSNKNLITLSRVNINDYQYNYNWWWFHHFMMQQMQMQQMMRMQTMPNVGGGRFGPNHSFDEDDIIFEKKIEYQSLSFILDSNFNVEKDNKEETEYKNFDKDEILEEFNKDKSIKNFSSTFLDNEMRYIYQNSKTNTVYIDFKSI